MKRLLMILGGVAAVMGVLVVGAIVFAVIQGGSLDTESKAYVEDSVKAITSHWDKEAFLSRASPELLATMKPGDVTRLFDSLSQLGSLVEYEGATGDARFFYSVGTGKTTTAQYIAKARYMNGEASIRISLRKHDGVWKIFGFHVSIEPGSKLERHT